MSEQPIKVCYKIFSPSLPFSFSRKLMRYPRRAICSSFSKPTGLALASFSPALTLLPPLYTLSAGVPQGFVALIKNACRMRDSTSRQAYLYDNTYIIYGILDWQLRQLLLLLLLLLLRVNNVGHNQKQSIVKVAKRSSAKQTTNKSESKSERQLKTLKTKIIGLQMLPGILLIERKNRKSLNLCPLIVKETSPRCQMKRA